MGMGRWPGDRQREFWVAADGLAAGPGHVFYDALNRLLDEAEFDARVEELCAPFYAEGGRDSIPPGRYFRMLFVGYFEGLDSQRAIAWRCADSLSLRRFLELGAEEESPDHSSLTRIRDRLPPAVPEAVFVLVLGIAREKGLLSGRQVGVDSTLLEANAAMKSIVRRDTGEDWKEYLRRLAAEQGVEIENDEDLRRFDLQRKKAGEKKVSNEEWTSPSDPDSRIVKMKDGRTHLGHKAEHVVDLQSEFILSATVCEGTAPDTDTLLPSLAAAQVNLIRAGSEEDIKEVAADKGYHSNAVLTDVKKCGIRTYIPERETGPRRWTDKSPGIKSAFHDNRRRVRRAKGRKLQRLRSERGERSFAHVCETGAARRTWLRGTAKINNRYQVHVAARNLGLVLRALFGSGTPRGLAARLTTISETATLQRAATPRNAGETSGPATGSPSRPRLRDVRLGWRSVTSNRLPRDDCRRFDPSVSRDPQTTRATPPAMIERPASARRFPEVARDRPSRRHLRSGFPRLPRALDEPRNPLPPAPAGSASAARPDRLRRALREPRVPGPPRTFADDPSRLEFPDTVIDSIHRGFGPAHRSRFDRLRLPPRSAAPNPIGRRHGPARCDMATRRLRSAFDPRPTQTIRTRFVPALLLACATGGCTSLRTGPWPTARVDDPAALSPYRQPMTRPQTVGRLPSAPNPNATRNLFAPQDNTAARPTPLSPVPQTEPLPSAGPSTTARPQTPAVPKFPAAPNPSAGATPRTTPDPAAAPDGPTIVPPQTQAVAALALTVEAPARVAVDGGAVFRFRIVNNGTATARDIVLACELDDALRMPGRSDRLVERKLAELPAGAAREFALTLASRTAGRPCVRVRLLEGTREAAWKSVCLEVVERRLAVDVVGPERRTVGTRAEFLLKLTNVSAEPLSNVVVVVRHDPSLQAKEASAGALQETHALRWNLGDIAVGESVQPQVEFACAAPSETACLFVTVQGAGLPDEVLERCLAVEAPQSSLVLHVADSVDPVRLGDETVLSAWVSHREPQPIRGLEFELTLPERLRVSAIEVFADRERIEAAPKIDGRTVRLGPLPDLAAGVRLEIRAAGKALRDGDDEFRAKIVGGTHGTGLEASERMTINR